MSVTAASGPFDLVIVGGGVNGAGIARDAAGRGLSVLLCERDDLAAHTSSSSTKLVHGGLRYLEHYAFGLVRKALAEREVLLRAAPHIMRPLRFVMPHDRGQRPAWMVRAGLFLYDHLARRELLPDSTGVALRRHPAGVALKPEFTRGFEYSDVWVDDARLVVLCARDAAERGAVVRTRTTVTQARRENGLWAITLAPSGGSTSETVHARALVNAAGPWTASFLGEAVPGQHHPGLRLVKGSHIVVRRQLASPHAFIFQNTDERIVFAIPYERDFTLIGTTDVDVTGQRGPIAISQDEIDYLCAAVNRYFAEPVTPADVAWTYAGVRPLLADGHEAAAEVTRDYRLDLDTNGPPVLSIFGGKITTFRRLAEDALERLAPHLPMPRGAWTHAAPLPGGDLPVAHPGSRALLPFDAFVRETQAANPGLPGPLIARYARAYGSRLAKILGAARDTAGLGEEILPGVFEAEVRYLVSQEWARTADDILWRRSKLGLHLPADAPARLDAWMARHGLGNAPAREETLS
ncbi:glycerol-3-phosphate dehydrogenase [Achromobacter sp. GG226]|uniref:glycerol-3-phosphate dehydrogenase n=1 Tax=Verticiella alkaliphila TaxID=2779529 RepID=UPI001C0E5E1E|nr:glycerol-3-phosphate dehydrogenase [Verticiella sp. GG226]MBU4611265.1 glycerol-3-phosphate dehydrogenase [Verticiella sp. GG226]